MSKGITRRDWLKLIGGSAAGLMLTPIPWKILDETAKWSQNWSWTPVLRNGKINFKYTTCTLCPMACGVRVRCVGNQPVSLTGIPKHPISGGGLCAIGLGGHLLPYHPARLLQPQKIIRGNGEIRPVSLSYEEAVAAIAGALTSSTKGSVAILDGQPKRTISFVYRKFLAGLTDGIYIVPTPGSGMPAEITERVLNKKKTPFGFNVENTRTILSFGAPVLDGWGTLGQFSTIVKKRTGDDKLRVIQVEPLHSRTAQISDEWIPVKPGTEATFALAIANVLIKEKLCDIEKLMVHSSDFDNGMGKSFRDLANSFSPASISRQTGISEDKINSIARMLASEKPSLVVFDGTTFSRDEQIIFTDLNILLGAVGEKGGLVPRDELPVPVEGELADETSIADVPDHSVKVLIIDGAEPGSAFPWKLLEQKLIPDNSMVISLSPYFSGIACYADYIIPTPTYLESYNDSPTPSSVTTASYSISTPILTGPRSIMEPLDAMKKIAAATQTDLGNAIQSFGMMALIEKRVKEIYETRKGLVFNSSTSETMRLRDISSSDQLMKLLSNGGCWYNDAFRVRSTESRGQYSLLGGRDHGFEKLFAAASRNREELDLVLLPYTASPYGIGQSHQLMQKLSKESDLRDAGNVASIHPDTGKKLKLTDSCKCVVKTESGTSKVKVKFDQAVMPGVIQVAVGQSGNGPAESQDQNILEICKIENDSTWRITKAEIIQA